MSGLRFVSKRREALFLMPLADFLGVYVFAQQLMNSGEYSLTARVKQSKRMRG